MRLIAVILTLLFAAPAIASAETIFYDFTWNSVDNAFGRSPVTLTGQSTATLTETTFTVQPGNAFPGAIFRFEGPGRGPFDGLYGSNLEKLPNGVFQAQIAFPAALHDFREGAGDLTPTNTGFAVRASVPGSGPDAGALFRGTMTARTVQAQALEPSTVILAAAGLAGAASIRRRRRSS